MDMAGDAPGSSSEDQWKLDNIPKEVFLHVCSFLSMKLLKNVLRNVCQQFMDIIDDDINWKIRLKERWPKRYPLIRTEEFQWCEACQAREEVYNLWSNQAANMKKCHVASAHFASVDVVQFIEDGRFFASGARDHAIKLWDMEAFSNSDDYSSADPGISNGIVLDTSLSPYHRWIEGAHSGWIWCMAYSENHKTLYSGSWDSTIKSWDLHHFSVDAEINSYRVAAAVLCLGMCGDVVTCGRYDSKVNAYDVRMGNRPILERTMHQKSVLCMTTNEKYIISGSVDNTIVIFDRVAGRKYRTIHLDNYAVSLCYAHDHLWIGDKQGFIHLIDPTCDKFELIKTYPSGHKGQITGIHFSLGAIITSSLDKSISVLEPSAEPQPIIKIPYQSQVAGIAVHNNKLVTANTDSSVTIWLPFNTDILDGNVANIVT